MCSLVGAMCLFITPCTSSALVDVNGMCVAAEWNNYGGISKYRNFADPVYFSWNPYLLIGGDVFPEPVYGGMITAEFTIYYCVDGEWQMKLRDGRTKNVESWSELIMEVNGTDIEISFNQLETVTCCGSAILNFGPPPETNKCM